MQWEESAMGSGVNALNVVGPSVHNSVDDRSQGQESFHPPDTRSPSCGWCATDAPPLTSFILERKCLVASSKKNWPYIVHFDKRKPSLCRLLIAPVTSDGRDCRNRNGGSWQRLSTVPWNSFLEYHQLQVVLQKWATEIGFLSIEIAISVISIDLWNRIASKVPMKRTCHSNWNRNSVIIPTWISATAACHSGHLCLFLGHNLTTIKLAHLPAWLHR